MPRQESFIQQFLLAFFVALFSAVPSMAQKPKISLQSPKGGENFLIPGPAIDIMYVVTGAPPKASVGLFIYQNVPESEKKPAPEGPITARSIPLHESGAGHYSWTLNTLACLKGSDVTTCPTQILSGAYRIEAVLYQDSDLPLLGATAPSATDALALAFTAEFTVTGQEQKEEMIRSLDEAAVYKYLKLTNVDVFPGMNLRPYMNFGSPVQGPTKDGKLCKKVFATAPFAGEILACTTQGDPEKKVSVGGKITPVHNIISYEKAKALAIEVAAKKYNQRVDFPSPPSPDKLKTDPMLKQATYLAASISHWIYIPGDKGGRWVFGVRLRKDGGLATGSDRFDDVVVMSIGDNGSTCLTQIVGHSTGKNLNLKEIMNHCSQ